jgi:RNA polymerase sigma factor for flagellar operon FliA
MTTLSNVDVHQDALPMLRRIACSLRSRLPRFVAVDDLVAAGGLGYAEALQRWRPDGGASFATFADKRVRGAMIDWIRREVRSGRVLGAEMSAELAAEGDGDGCDGSGGEGVEVPATFGQRVADIALGCWLQDGEERLRANSSPVLSAMRSELRDRLQQALATLTASERQLLAWIHQDGLSLSEIGARLGRDKTVVHRRHQAVLRRLRHWLGAAAEAVAEVA